MREDDGQSVTGGEQEGQAVVRLFCTSPFINYPPSKSTSNERTVSCGGEFIAYSYLFVSTGSLHVEEGCTWSTVGLQYTNQLNMLNDYANAIAFYVQIICVYNKGL